MKPNKKLIIITYLCLTVIGILCIFYFFIPKGPKATYSINSTFLIENKKGAMTSQCYKTADLFNNEDSISFPVKIQNQNDRDICYSVILIMNDKQILTTVDKDTALHHDYKIKANDFLNINVEIEKEYFDEQSVNELLFVFRQDIDCFSVDNPLLEKSNTIFLNYAVSSLDEPEEKNQNASSEKKPVLEITPLEQPENGLIKKKNHRTLGIKITPTSVLESDYKVFCLIGSDITNFDDKNYLYLNASTHEPVITDIDISSAIGKNEVELFAVPIDRYVKQEEIIKGNRFTLSDQ